MKKKLLLILFSCLATTFCFAQKNELGVVVGSYNGLSYKRVVNDKFATLTEVGFGLQATKYMDHYSSGGLNISIHGNIDLWDVHINQNFLFNYEISNNLFFYAGGGVTIGYAQEFNYNEEFAKTGINAIVGLEYRLPTAPLGIAFDFRPGYANLTSSSERDVNVSIFDWKLALALRYCF